MRRREKRQPRSITAMTWLLVLLTAAVWGGSMFCVTSVAAEYAGERYMSAYGDFATTIANRDFYHWYGKGLSQKYENYDLNLMWEAVDAGGLADSFIDLESPSAGGRRLFFERLESDRVWSVTAIYDAQGGLMECGWRDFIYFEYLTPEQWAAGEGRSANCARAYIDRTKLTEDGISMLSDSAVGLEMRALRFEGAFDGVNFVPSSIEYVSYEDFDLALQEKGWTNFNTVSGVVGDSGIQWQPLYDDPGATPPEESVTLYSDWFDVCYYDASPSFRYRGTRYRDTAALAERLGPEFSNGPKDLPRYEGMDLIIPSVSYCVREDGELLYTPRYYGTEGEELQFYTVSVVYCDPWATAVRELVHVYVFTAALALALVLMARSTIKRRLAAPLNDLADSAEGGWGPLPDRDRGPGLWAEVSRIVAAFNEERDRRRMRDNEIARLNAALDYAEAAEENRRKMTSAVAHELKTPLAVIHSCAEGLKEHIAEDKRDKYLDIILAETRHTDALVMELLDLSRLEAGKVKLSRDDFDLAELTRHVFGKFSPSARERELRVELDLPEHLTVTADEARMAQVIENLASNAVRYTPEGGHIGVSLRRSGAEVRFSVENDSAPLPDDALERVWDTFYRADESRSGAGTGLGLAIVKSIIELHGGKCFARNTQAGVEFGFQISS